MKGKLILLTLAVFACIGLTSCNKNKDKQKDPLASTTWTAYDGDYLMVLKFEMGTTAVFYIGDESLSRRSEVSYSLYTLTDDTKLSFSDFNGSMENVRYRFKAGTLNGDTMTVNYDRWTSASGMDSQKQHLQAVFRKQNTSKK